MWPWSTIRRLRTELRRLYAQSEVQKVEVNGWRNRYNEASALASQAVAPMRELRERCDELESYRTQTLEVLDSNSREIKRLQKMIVQIADERDALKARSDNYERCYSGALTTIGELQRKLATAIFRDPKTGRLMKSK